MDYRSAGVNISLGNQLVSWLKKQISKTKSPCALQSVKLDRGWGRVREAIDKKLKHPLTNSIGSYSGLFSGQFVGIKNPYLVASTDGVGTKLQLAEYFKSYEEVGRDLVAMCVNDVICCGGTPLFFLDYYACSRLRLKPAQQFLKGVLSACEDSACMLLGGETAEMPGSYQKNHFDCAGFVLGVVDRSQILGAHKVRVGDILIGVSSSGFHSNGFSLLRQVFKKDLKRWKNQLLQPTALYVRLAQKLFKVKGLKALAHITGGGIDNILRVLPTGTRPKIKKWDIPDMFLEVQKRAKLSRSSLLKTLNCGVGLVALVSPSDSSRVKSIITKQGFSALDLGEVVESNR